MTIRSRPALHTQNNNKKAEKDKGNKGVSVTTNNGNRGRDRVVTASLFRAIRICVRTGVAVT